MLTGILFVLVGFLAALVGTLVAVHPIDARRHATAGCHAAN